jgi:hypothetical protein
VAVTVRLPKRLSAGDEILPAICDIVGKTKGSRSLLEVERGKEYSVDEPHPADGADRDRTPTDARGR